MRILAALFFLGGLACQTSTCARKSTAGHNAGDVVLVDWTLPTQSGGIPCQRGTLYVRENRSSSNNRVIGIGFVRFKGPTDSTVPPTIHLADGPGKSFLFRCDGPDVSPLIPLSSEEEDIKRYQAVSDTIYFDQRGFSKSGEVLTYGYKTTGHPANQPGSLAQRMQDEVALAQDAMAHFTNSVGIDLAAYSIKECAADVNDLRTALQYNQVTLIGHSFGGQWAFATIRLFPQIVARAIIAGVEPLGCAYDMPTDVLTALRQKWAYAQTLPAFQDYLPPDKSGIEGAVRAIIRRLELAPVSVTIPYGPMPLAVTIVLGRDDFRVDELDPKAILEIYHRRYQTWATKTWAARRAHKDYLRVIKPLIDTGLGATEARRQLLRTDPALDVVSQRDFELGIATEGIWPTPDVGDEFRTEISANTPVLFVQGMWDTQTPPENLQQVQPYFVNSRTLIVTNTGHNVLQDLEAIAMDVLIDFIKMGNSANLPSSVTLDPYPAVPAPTFTLP